MSAPAPGPAEMPHIVENAMRDAAAWADAWVRDDFEGQVRYELPRFVEHWGGPARAVASYKRFAAMAKDAENVPESATVERPTQIVRASHELHALFRVNFASRVPFGTFSWSSHILGVSEDEGETWTFITAGNLAEVVRRILPHFNPELKLPMERRACGIGGAPSGSDPST